MDPIKRPLFIIPVGLREWFMREACPAENVSPLHEIREIDPTRPGLDEFEELIGADFELEDDNPAPAPAERPKLRLAAFLGQRLDI